MAGQEKGIRNMARGGKTTAGLRGENTRLRSRRCASGKRLHLSTEGVPISVSLFPFLLVQ